jgi:hypothetical protein
MFPSWQETMVELHRAESVEQLWMVLVTPHGIRSSAMWEEPYGLFRHFHENDPKNSEMTAALLCTDHRWRRGTHLLIEHLTRSGLLSDTAMDQMARWFLEDDLVVTAELDVDEDTPPLDASDGGLLVQRGIWPPLRRWAAARVVSRDPSQWRMVLDRAQGLAARDAAAVAAGVMDMAGRIPPAERDEALEVGLGWRSGIVRLAALPALAEFSGRDIALARAAGDPSAKVRAWATSRAAPQTQADEDRIDRGEAPAPSESGSAGQDSLF